MGFFQRLFGLGSKPATRSVAVESAAVHVADLPSPPAGFIWHRFPEARLTVLRPDGWHVHQVDYEDFTGCVSKECIQKEGSFRTGFTLLLFRGIKDLLRQSNPDFHPDAPIVGVFESRYAGLLSDPCNRVLYSDEGVRRTAHSRLYRLQYRQALPGRPPIIVQKFLIDFDQSADVYEFIFESPESTWDRSWQKGKQILTNLVFSANPSTNLVFSVDPPLPSDDVLQAKVLEVGRAMGWSLEYENRPESLFIWRVQLPLPGRDAARTIGCCFSWYMKRVDNEIWVNDPLQFEPVDGMSAEVAEQLADAARGLQEDFKQRWLALVGPVTLQGASPGTHSLELQMGAMLDLLQQGRGNEFSA